MQTLLARQTMIVRHAPFILTAASGLVVLAVSIATLTPDPATLALWLAALVLMPLALGLMPVGRYEPSATLHRAACAIQFPAALALVASCVVPAGSWAALVAIPWFLFTALVAAWGTVRCVMVGRACHDVVGRPCHNGRRWHDVVALLPALYLLVGGTFTVLTRAGLQPLGFDHEIVKLTAIHFHYAGFVLPILATQVTKASPGRISRWTLAIIVAAVPLVAIGITLSPLVEIASAVVLATACMMLAGLQLRIAVSSSRPARLTLLALSAASLFTAMPLAAVYAASEFCGLVLLDIPTMVIYHGLTNAFGFALCGLWAWNLGPADQS